MNKKKAFQISALVICFIFIGRYFLNHQNEIIILSQIKLTNLFLITFLYTVILFLFSQKMHLILRKLDLKDITPFKWFKIYVISRFVNAHISQGGNIYRMHILKKKLQFPYTKTIGMTAVFTWLETIFTLLMGIIFISFIDPHLVIFNVPAITILWASLLPILIVPFIAKIALKNISFQNKFLAWMHERFSVGLNSFYECYKDKMLIAIQFFLSLISLTIIVLINDLIFKALGIHLSLPSLILFIVVLNLSSFFTITPGNIGITEIIYGYLSKTIGNSFGEGIIACALLRIILYFITAFLTILFVNTLSFKKILKTHEP